MTEKEKFLSELGENGLYDHDIDYVSIALDKGVTMEQIRNIWELDIDYLTFRCVIRALSKGLDMPVAEYLIEHKELSYDVKNELIAGFKKGWITVEQAERYIMPEYDHPQVQGICELLGVVEENIAKHYIIQPFRLRQFEWIAYGYRHGYPDYVVDMYAKPEITSTVMEMVCDLVDRSVEHNRIKYLLVPGFTKYQAIVIKDAILSGLPLDILEICAKRNLRVEKMRYIIQGYKAGMDELQLLRLVDCKHNYVDLYKRLLQEKAESGCIAVPCDDYKTKLSYDKLLSVVKEMSKSFTGKQRKELVNIILYSE